MNFIWQFLKVLNIELPDEPAIPLLGAYPREQEPYAHTKTCVQMFVAAFIKAKKQPKCLSTAWINKMWYSHIKEYYSA